MIKSAGNGMYRLWSQSQNRPLSKKPQTLEEAKKQEAAINISKARAAGHKMPNK